MASSRRSSSRSSVSGSSASSSGRSQSRSTRSSTGSKTDSSVSSRRRSKSHDAHRRGKDKKKQDKTEAMVTKTIIELQKLLKQQKAKKAKDKESKKSRSKDEKGSSKSKKSKKDEKKGFFKRDDKGFLRDSNDRTCRTMSSRSSNVIVSEQWEIELIRSHYPPDVRSGEGKAFYRVLWRLAPGAEESWEEEENWVHEDDMSCPELIKAYWSEYQDKCRTSGVVLDNPPASVKRKYTSRTPSLASVTKSRKKQPTSAKKKKTAFVERKKQDHVEKKTSASVMTKQAEKEKRRTPTSHMRKHSWLQSDESANESDIAEETQDKQPHTPVSKSILFDVASSPSAASKEKDSLMIGEVEALRQQQQKNEELRRQIAELEKSSIDDMQLPLEQIDDGMEKLEKSPPNEVRNKQSVRSVQKTLLHEVLTKKTPSGGRPHKRPRTSDVASPLDETLRFIRAIKEDTSPASPSTTFSKLCNTPGSNKKGPPRAKKNKPTLPPKTAETEKANIEKDAVMAVISEETDEGDAEEVAGGPVEPNALKEILTEELVNLLNLKQYAGIMDLLKRFAKECWNRNQDALKTLKPVYVLAFLPSLDGEPEQDWSVTIFENIPGQMPNHICQCVPTEQLFSKYPAVVIEAEQRFYTVV